MVRNGTQPRFFHSQTDSHAQVGQRERFVSPPRLARILQRLGPLSIKAGQFLATRPDLIPQDYCDELLKLVDRVPPFSWRVARNTIKEDLGVEPEELFAWINPSPLAAASLAQVHVARLRRDTSIHVAVKVQREGIAEQVDRDLKRLSWVLEVLRRFGVLSIVSLPELEAELRRWLLEELDMKRELTNLTRMYELTDPSGPAKIPRPFPDYCGGRVLTAEYLRGVPFSELLRRSRAGKWREIEQMSFDPDALARNLIESVLTQIFEHQFFHGDTHPGNLIALQGNRVGFVDFGRADILDPNLRRRQADYVAAVYSGDQDRIYRNVIEILVPSKHSDLERFRAGFQEAVRVWRHQTSEEGETGRNGARSALSNYFVTVLRLARESRFRLPTEALAMYRALLTADSVASQLGRRGELARTGERFFERLRRKDIVNSLMPDNVGALAIDMVELAQSAPSQLTRILSDLTSERFILHVRTTDNREDRRYADNRARLVVLSLITVSLTILLFGYPRSPILSKLPLEIPLLSALLAAFIGIAILWRRMS